MAAFGSTRRTLTLSEAAALLDLPKGTTRRALYTLTCLGYMESSGKTFSLTPKVLQFAKAYLAADPVTVLYQPACERILAEIKTFCTVAVLDADNIMIVARAAPVGWLSTNYGSQYRVPAFCSALGRTLLAAFSDADLKSFIDRLKPLALTPYTVTSKAEIHSAVLDVRRDGYCFIDQEAELGFRSIAVPIKRYNDDTVAALNIGARVEAISKDAMITTYRDVLFRTAETMQKQLT